MEFYYHFKDYVKDKYFDELKNMSAPLREAKIFEYTCRLIPIGINEGDLIGGRYAVAEKGADYSYTERKFPFSDALTEEEKAAKDAFFKRFAIDARFDRGHFCADYEKILRFGIKFYEAKIKNELSRHDTDGKKREYLLAMLESIAATRIYTERFASLAENMYKKDGGEWLLKIRDAYRKVPYEPAENIFEALCAVWIMHSLLPMSDGSFASISLGRMDSYLYPFYEKSLRKGESRENVKEYLKCLFMLLNSYGDGACNLNIGGLTEDGVDAANELTYLLIEAEKEIRLPSPIFAVRVHDKTPERIFDETICEELFTIGQPTFYGETPCRLAMRERGLSEGDAARFTANSCMGLYLCGEEISSMWGIVFNMHLPLELAVNHGKPTHCEIPISVSECRENIDSLDALLSEYEKYLGELLAFFFEINRKNAKNRAQSTPNPLLSALTAGCIERGLDRALGAKYNTETVETMALVNTANAIAAIDTLVFREKKYTLDEIVNAAKNNFSGAEEILRDIKKCEKYGTSSALPDSIVRRICEMTSRICKEHSKDNVYFLPSLHTLDTNVRFGAKLYTTLDGRLAGAPVAKNAGPTDDVRTSEPTSLVLSAASIRQELFSGGQPIDLYFDRSLLSTEESQKKIEALIKTYFKLGGLQIQVNSANLELLKKAYAEPESCPNLIVRIGGYSRRFSELDKRSQREFIERFERESCG